MEFGLDKCAKTVHQKWKLVHSEVKEPEHNLPVPRYLRMWRYANYRQTEERINQEIKFSAKNNITATGALADSVFRYSFDIFKWRLHELRKTGRKTRKMLTMNKMHHPKAAIDRLYLKRKEGRRGLLQISVTYRAGNEYYRMSEYTI